MIVLRLFIFCMYQEIIMLEVHANKSDIIKWDYAWKRASALSSAVISRFLEMVSVKYLGIISLHFFL